MTEVFEAFAPGRTEIAGNHLDHQGGTVLAATIAQGISAQAVLDGSGVIAVESDGYDAFTITRASLRRPMDPSWKGTARAIMFGMARELGCTGAHIPGMLVTVSSRIPAGGGLSSSAAFELLCGRIIEKACGIEPRSDLEMAKLAQFVERSYFGKPCGLMDQTVIAHGGTQIIDFSDAQEPRCERLDADLAALGYAIVLTDTGIRHDGEEAAAQFAQIPEDMWAVARALGARRLSEVDRRMFMVEQSRLRAELGARPVARAMHFFLEQELTRMRIEALRSGNMRAFLAAMRRSCASNRTYLDNIGAAAEALDLACELDGSGESRIHGGGFGGSIQTVLPLEDAPAFMAGMEEGLEGARCMLLELTDEGAWAR